MDFEIDARLHGVYGLLFYTRYVRDVMCQEGVGCDGLFLMLGRRWLNEAEYTVSKAVLVLQIGTESRSHM